MSGVRILVVDDDGDVAGMAALMLRKAGHEVESALSGPEALTRIARTAFDLILLDINMPGMDGWEVLRVLKADGATSAIPVAMLSGRGEVRDKVHGMQEGAVDYITKPFSYDDITGRVAVILRRDPGRATGGASL